MSLPIGQISANSPHSLQLDNLNNSKQPTEKNKRFAEDSGRGPTTTNSMFAQWWRDELICSIFIL